jgi:hypothetical protein
MNFSVEIIKPFVPVLVILLALMPFLFFRLVHKNAQNRKLAENNWLIAYLIVLVLAAFMLVVLQGMQLMAVDSSDRSLFICSILLIACIDQLLNLLPLRIRLQFDIAELLLYSTLLICSVPLLWQVSRYVVPLEISSKPGIMRAVEISLMLIMVVLCVSSGFIKKSKPKQN